MRIFRFRNRILQLLYRPVPLRIFSEQTLSTFDALDKAINKNVTPLLAELLDG